MSEVVEKKMRKNGNRKGKRPLYESDLMCSPNPNMRQVDQALSLRQDRIKSYMAECCDLFDVRDRTFAACKITFAIHRGGNEPEETFTVHGKRRRVVDEEVEEEEAEGEKSEEEEEEGEKSEKCEKSEEEEEIKDGGHEASDSFCVDKDGAMILRHVEDDDGDVGSTEEEEEERANGEGEKKKEEGFPPPLPACFLWSGEF